MWVWAAWSAMTATVATAAATDTFLEYGKFSAPTSGTSAEIGGGRLGIQVAVSADGSTAISGAFEDDGSLGAAYVFTRSGQTWTLQAKLTAPTSGANREIGNGELGTGIAISADGNTALLGGFADANDVGGAWVFVRSGGAWSVQKKLTAPTSGADQEIGQGEFGSSVSLSADGDTALIDAITDNNGAGAVWAFTRAGTTWTERHKLTAPTAGPDAGIGVPDFGSGSALTPDGQTVIVPGFEDNNDRGAAWVFSNSGETWPEQAKLTAPTTGPDAAVSTPLFGSSVAVASDGNTVLAGAQADNNDIGAGWVFTRSGTTWTEQAKLTAPTVGPNAEIGAGFMGVSATMAADGSSALLGASSDTGGDGAAFQFDRTGTSWAVRGKLTVPAGPDAEIGPAALGESVALSTDGSTLLIGGAEDNSSRGAVWTYASTPAPAVSSVTPAAGPTAGGTTVAIHGDGFAATGLDAVSSVTFAGVPARSYTVVSATEIDAVTPPHAPGAADVIVTSPAGTSAIGTADQFAYVAIPSPPTVLKATAGNRRAKVSFKAPAEGATSYTVTTSPGGAQTTGAHSPITVTGLTNGKRYTFTLTATNAGGTSVASEPSAAVTPFAPARATKLALTNVASRDARLAITVTAGKSSPGLRSVTIALPRGLSFAKSEHVRFGTAKLRASAHITHGRLTVTLRRSTSRLQLTVDRISVSSGLARQARHNHHVKATVSLQVTDSAHNFTSIKHRLRLQ
jgi:hypothetical protein